MYASSEVRFEVNVAPLRRRFAVPLGHRVRLGRLRERAALPRPLLLRLFRRPHDDAVRHVVLARAEDWSRDVLFGFVECIVDFPYQIQDGSNHYF